MALSNYEQAHNLFGRSKNILIIAGQEEIDDTYPASLALARVLKINKKTASIFAPGQIPEYFSFLENRRFFAQKNIHIGQDIIVSMDISQKPIGEIGYKKNGSRLDIHISPKENVNIEEGDIHVKRGSFKYDLAITIGLRDLESLGEEFNKNTAFFFETPIINIDRSSSNERYGEINIIELTSSSCSEILSNILISWNEGLIKKRVATCLLCGIIASTNNFQARATPQTLFASAKLMSRDADQQEIIKNIFKTKSFELLKIWGIAMSKLRFDTSKRVGWLTLTDSDFNEAGTSPKSIPLVLKELRNNFSDSAVFLIFWENSTSSFAIANTPHKEQLNLLSKELNGELRGNNLLLPMPPKNEVFKENLVGSIVRALGV